MQGLKGKTGLTQKEAIFQIIKGVLGPAYSEEINVSPLILKRNLNFGRRRHDSPELDSIAEKIEQGIVDGSIPSEKYNSGKGKISTYSTAEYARRIAIYWIRRDKRLNGGDFSNSRKKRNLIEAYQVRRDRDPLIHFLKEKISKKSKENKLTNEMLVELLDKKIRLLFDVFDLDVESLPQDVLDDFYIILSDEKDKAA